MRAQYKYLSQLKLERAQNHRLVIEYGNTTSNVGATKNRYVTFLDVLNPSVWQRAGVTVSKVDFNINPRYNIILTRIIRLLMHSNYLFKLHSIRFII